MKHLIVGCFTAAGTADDPDCEVRTQVALNPNCPPDVLARLANDTYEQVRTEVACHPRTPLWVVQRLAEHDPADSVRSWAARTLQQRRR